MLANSDCAYSRLTDRQFSELELSKERLTVLVGCRTLFSVLRNSSLLSIFCYENPTGVIFVHEVLEQEIMTRPPGCNLVLYFENRTGSCLNVLDDLTWRRALFVVVIFLERDAVDDDLDLDTRIRVEDSHGVRNKAAVRSRVSEWCVELHWGVAEWCRVLGVQ